ncbi:MAG: Fe-S cluster assembly protein SufD [Chloroflexi bacterium]|nr:Fe-S cluster assembly protein SufD [Chloroflexota bacterium]
MYERTVISTSRAKKAEAALPRFAFTRADVEAIAAKTKEPAWLTERRLAAWQTFEATPMPTLNDEAWRRTDLRPLKAGQLALPSLNGKGPARRAPAYLHKPLVGKQQGGLLVINQGKVEETALAPDLKKRGVIFTDFVTAARDHGDVVRKFIGRTVKPEDGKFAALSAALARTGVFVYVPKGVEVELPLHSVIWDRGAGASLFTQVLVAVDDGAQATFVHETASPTADGQSLHAGAVELIVEDNAHLKFVELQSWGEHVWNFTHERARIGRDSTFDWIFGAIGTRLTKSFMTVDLDGEGSTAKMSGFYFTDGDQHLDHDTQQNHNAAHATSDFLFKGALKGNSRSVWQGMIYVAPGAQKTDGYQANRNLVLSKNARADSIPGLEILADDVRCTHGATVGQIDQEHVFYLMSRGMPRPEAEKLVVDGFFDPIMQRIPYEGVRNRLKKAIVEKMG